MIVVAVFPLIGLESIYSLEIVVTGIGVVSPIGIGRDAFWRALHGGRSGIDRIRSFDTSGLPVTIAGEVRGFDAKQYVAQRKQLKVMSRDAQLGVAAAKLACEDAGIEPGKIDSERLGVVLGADRICSSLADSETTYNACIVDGRFQFGRWAVEGAAASFPLNFLKVLPNMIASHVSIAHDARGPNNTIHHGEASSLLAIAEAMHTIQRGAADIMLAGGASSQLNPFDCIRHCVMGHLSRRSEDPAGAMRPFDADRDGQVLGEGAAIFVLESRQHAEARGAAVLASLCSTGAAYDACGQVGGGLRRAMQLALERAHEGAEQLGFVSASGLGTQDEDRIEATAFGEVTPNVAVTATKSYFGNLGAAGGAMEMAATVLAVREGIVPKTLNYCRPDPRCPVRVVREEPMQLTKPAAMAVNRTRAGQAAAVVVRGV